MPKPERSELLEEAGDEAAQYIAKLLNHVADKQATTKRPKSCEVYRCTRPAGFTAWVVYFAHTTDTTPTSDERLLCRTHAETYAAKHQARKLTIAGRPVISYKYRWGLK